MKVTKRNKTRKKGKEGERAKNIGTHTHTFVVVTFFWVFWSKQTANNQPNKQPTNQPTKTTKKQQQQKQQPKRQQLQQQQQQQDNNPTPPPPPTKKPK